MPDDTKQYPNLNQGDISVSDSSNNSGDTNQVPDTNQPPTQPAPVQTTTSSNDFQTISQVAQDSNSTNPAAVVTSPHVPKKYGGKKILATIFGVALLVVGVTAGVLLVQRQQEISERAASGEECTHSPDCILLEGRGNSGSFSAPRIITRVDITARYFHEYFPGDTDNGCYKVSIHGRDLSWERIGSGPDCKDISNIQIWMGDEPTSTPTTPPSTPTEPPSTPTDGPTSTPTGTPTTTPTGTITITPTEPPTQPTAECSEVKAYNTSWVQLTQDQLDNLGSGDRVRFTVSGSTSEGTFDKARFTINGSQKDPVSTKKPGTEEFYYEYVIPSDETSFTVGAQVHHSSLGWF
jgi:hypothetical protein